MIFVNVAQLKINKNNTKKNTYKFNIKKKNRIIKIKKGLYISIS